MIKRTDNKYLPDDDELKIILEKETYFPIPKGKESVHYPRFETIIDLLDFLKLSSNLFKSNIEDVYGAVREGKNLLNQVVDKCLSCDDKKIIDLFNNIYDYLSKEDNLEECDMVFVFGAKTPLRAIKGAEIFNKLNAKKIIVSGGLPIYADKTEIPESIKYKRILIENGINERNIIVESKSITLPDNVWCSLIQLDKLNFNFKSIAIVNSPYSQRRGWCFFKKYLPESIKIIRVNSDSKITKENWYKSEEGLRVVLNEFMKMRASVVYNTA